MTEIITATAIATPIVKSLISTILANTIKPAIRASQSITDPILDLISNRFSEYLERQYLKHSFLPTIVFQIRKPLEDLYIPVTLQSESNIQQLEENKSYKIDGFNKEFIPKLKRILVTDDAGMGKSTLSRYLMVQATKQLAVPVFIELRHLSASRTIIELLLSELNPAGLSVEELKVDKRNLIRLLNKGIFTFFLDGYDEISLKDKEKVTVDIKQFTESYANNNFLITSRPENALASFSSFYTFKIKPLKIEEAFSLIRKYDNDGEKSKRLIEKLQDKTLKSALEFLQNPLLTTLLFRAYDYKNLIPLKKGVFYRQVFDALYEWHDSTKDGYSTREKTSGLDIDGFHKILRGIGFISTMKSVVETDTDGMLKWIREARTYAPELKFSESDFLEDAIKAVPIFRREGNSILWSHKSMAEYFAAQFIISDAKTDQEKICTHIANLMNLPSYSNLLDLLYDIDIDVFNLFFTKPLLALYKAHETILISKYPGVSLNEVKRRAATTFGIKLLHYGQTKGDLGRYHNKLISIINNYQDSVIRLWHPTANIDKNFRNSIKFNITRTSGVKNNKQTITRFLKFDHPLMTVFDVLQEKKSNLIINRALIDLENNNKIIGLRNTSMLAVEDDSELIWNSVKNFKSTTNVIINAVENILNVEKIDPTLREIELRTSSSSITSALLESIAK